MNGPDPNADLSMECDPQKAADAAELVRRDFGALLEVLELQLASLPESDTEHRAHIEEARSAAERGIRLSDELIDMLRNRG